MSPPDTRYGSPIAAHVPDLHPPRLNLVALTLLSVLTIPVAAFVPGPILLVSQNRLPGDIATELQRLDPELVYVIGGRSAISDGVVRPWTPPCPRAPATSLRGRICSLMSTIMPASDTAPGTVSGRRADGRVPTQLRPVKIVPDYLKFAEGSVLIRVGDTRVICAATIEDRVPGWMRGKGRGWVTAEYSMLPRAGTERSQREAARGSIGGRTHEIQRLIGRSLRGVIDMSRLGERTITLDCDVIQADGGTRTASITGAYVALARALNRYGMGHLLTGQVAAVSAGIVKGSPFLDLDYSEDSTAEVDFNVVMTDDDRLIEVQGTAEHGAFTRQQMDAMIDLAAAGIRQLFGIQRTAIGAATAE